jgi:hypothetical protein
MAKPWNSPAVAWPRPCPSSPGRRRPPGRAGGRSGWRC